MIFTYTHGFNEKYFYEYLMKIFRPNHMKLMKIISTDFNENFLHQYINRYEIINTKKKASFGIK